MIQFVLVVVVVVITGDGNERRKTEDTRQRIENGVVALMQLVEWEGPKRVQPLGSLGFKRLQSR